MVIAPASSRLNFLASRKSPIQACFCAANGQGGGTGHFRGHLVCPSSVRIHATHGGRRMPVPPRFAILGSLVALTAGVAAQGGAQAPRALTAADYARAEKFMNYNV